MPVSPKAGHVRAAGDVCCGAWVSLGVTYCCPSGAVCASNLTFKVTVCTSMAGHIVTTEIEEDKCSRLPQSKEVTVKEGTHPGSSGSTAVVVKIRPSSLPPLPSEGWVCFGFQIHSCVCAGALRPHRQ